MGSFSQKAPQRTSDTSRRPPVAQSAALSPIQQLQRRAGNQALQRMVQAQAGKAREDVRDPVRIQPKLTINTPGDVHEQEADRVAEQVMRMPEPSAQSKAPAGVSGRVTESAARVQTRSTQAGDSGVAAAPPLVHDVLRSPGQPLDTSTRAFMEPRFGQDFGHVRVHTDAKAAESAAAINARAYTHGRDIVFGAGGSIAAGQGRGLLAHELTHVLQQNSGVGRPGIQRQKKGIAADLRAEADSPKREQGKLADLETKARTSADATFQNLIGAPPPGVGFLGGATAVISHLSNEIQKLENARARGYQQAVGAMIGQQALNSPQAANFWRAFAGNTLWALAGLVTLLGGPVAGVGEVVLAAGAGVLLRKNAIGAIGKFVSLGRGAVATTVVGLAGAELAQFSGGTPSGSSLPSTLDQIQDQFTDINSKIMSRYRIEAYALTLDFLGEFSEWVAPNNPKPVTATSLETLIKGSLMLTLFSDLASRGILDMSDYTIDAAAAQKLAKQDLLMHFILQSGAVQDVAFQSEDEIEDRAGGATGTSAALKVLGGETAFAGRLQGDYEFVVGNVNGTLAEWGAQSTLPLATQQAWITGKQLASGAHAVPFRITDPGQFANQLSGNNYDARTPGLTRVMDLRPRGGGTWSASVLPSTGGAGFSSSDFVSLSRGSRTFYALKDLTIGFRPSGTFTSAPMSERSSIEPSTRGQTEQFRFTGDWEFLDVHVRSE